jgi:hypothetical protein
MAFKIFIGWSGNKGKLLAPILANWIEAFFQRMVEVTTSELDLFPGEDFTQAIEKKLLKNRDAAIFCLSEDGLDSKWVQYEAGNIGKRGRSNKLIVPYLIGINKEDRKFQEKWKGPLSSYLAANANENDTRQMLMGINERLEMNYDRQKFDSAFQKKSPALMDEIKRIVSPSSKNTPEASIETIDVEEQLTIWENHTLGAMHNLGVRDKSYRTDAITIRKMMAKAGFSEGEFKLALAILLRRKFIRKVALSNPISFELTDEGIDYVLTNSQDFLSN